MGDTDASDCVGIDIGRHRLFVASAKDGHRGLVPMDGSNDGLLLRWLADDGPRRFSDRVRAFGGLDARASDASADVAAAVAPSLTGTEQIRVAVAPSFGPQCRADIIAGLRHAELNVEADDLIDRPVAAAAGWLAHRSAVSGAPLSHPVLLIDNDAGELSVVAFDPPTKRLLTVAPLSIPGDEALDDVAARLREVIDLVARLTHPDDELIRDDSLRASSARIREVVLTGNGAGQPELARLIDQLLPHATLAPDPVTPAEHCVATGLTHLDTLASWTACWPTLDLSSDDNVVLVQRGLHAIGEPDNECVSVDIRGIQLRGRDGQRVDIAAGSCRGGGITVPAPLRDDLRIKVLDDGRVLLLGPHGVPPLALQFGWPCPGNDVDSVAIRSVGRRAVTVAQTLPVLESPAAISGA